MKSSSLGESAITPQMISKIAPDVISPHGKQELFTKQQTAITQKPVLDILFKQIANKLGAQFSSRIKDPQTVVQKVAQKRMSGRDYQLKDINDLYGGRIVINNTEIKPIEKQMQAVGLAIMKSQPVKQDTYSAHHIDFQTPQGTKGELQIMTPKHSLEAVANHGIRSQYGENPPPEMKKIKDAIAKTAQQVPDDKAHAIAQALASMQQKQ